MSLFYYKNNNNFKQVMNLCVLHINNVLEQD